METVAPIQISEGARSRTFGQRLLLVEKLLKF